MFSLRAGRENIVSLIKVGPEYHEKQHSSGMAHWYVFNDFTVHSIKESEVAYMPIEWKQPCMLYYTKKDLADKYKDVKVSKSACRRLLPGVRMWHMLRLSQPALLHRIL